VLTESDEADLRITGELPKGLLGTLYATAQPAVHAARTVPLVRGDGMIHAFHLENGRASYRNRWVRTPKWEMEHTAGVSLSGSFGDPRYTDPRLRALNSTTANTTSSGTPTG